MPPKTLAAEARCSELILFLLKTINSTCESKVSSEDPLVPVWVFSRGYPSGKDLLSDGSLSPQDKKLSRNPYECFL